MEHSIQISPLSKHWLVRFQPCSLWHYLYLSLCRQKSLHILTFVFTSSSRGSRRGEQSHNEQERNEKLYKKTFVMLKRNSFIRHWLLNILQRKISFSRSSALVLFRVLLSPNGTHLELWQPNLKPWCWASAVRGRSWIESLASPGWPCTAEPPPPDLDPLLPALYCPSENKEDEGVL